MTDCQYEHEFNTRLTMAETNIENMLAAMSRYEENQAVLIRLSEAVENLSKSLSGMKKDISRLKERPAKRWEQVVDKLIFGVAASGLGAIVTMIVTRLLG